MECTRCLSRSVDLKDVIGSTPHRPACLFAEDATVHGARFATRSGRRSDRGLRSTLSLSRTYSCDHLNISSKFRTRLKPIGDERVVLRFQIIAGNAVYDLFFIEE